VSIFDFFKKRKHTKKTTENENMAEKEHFYQLFAKALTKEATIEEYQELFSFLVNQKSQANGFEHINIEFFQRDSADVEDFYCPMDYMPIFNMIRIDPELITSYIDGKIEFGEILISLFHEKRHATQTARILKNTNQKTKNDEETDTDVDYYLGANEEVVDNLLKKFLKDKNLTTVCEEWSKTRLRLKNEESSLDKELIDNFYKLFHRQYATNKNLKKFIRDIGFGFYLDSAKEIDARKWGFIETLSLIQSIKKDTEGIAFYQDWCKKQEKPLQDALSEEDFYITEYISQSRKFFNVDVSETELIDIIKQIQLATTKMQIQPNSLHDSYWFEKMCENMLEKLYNAKDFNTLTNYFFSIKYSKIYVPKALKDEIYLKLSTTTEIFGEHILFKTIQEKLPDQPKEIQERFNKNLLKLMLSNPSNLHLFSFLTDENKKLFITHTKQLNPLFSIYPKSDYKSNLSDTFATFDENNEADRKLVEIIFKRFEDGYNVYLGRDHDITERAKKQIETSGFNVLYYHKNQDNFKKLMERFGYGERFQEILARPDKKEKFDKDFISKIRKSTHSESISLSHKSFLNIFFNEFEDSQTNLLEEADDNITI